MVRGCLVFSDMEFDQPNSWETDYEVIQEEYKEKGLRVIGPGRLCRLEFERTQGQLAVGREREMVWRWLVGFLKNLLDYFSRDKGRVVNPEGNG
ncbi:LOW QUALITY PROTEIN: hypothetical protein CKAN_00739300 [Cinnamomum micranthum f. kanehirae]|uniref:DUF7788 domain-containing protein n=1 Tax=Cinnamomum micranthum f. kanehirae TaxID=337451 RepID=A0A443NK36_9MAGN|nr:LOW QUALITY PROTEIN: hypothetical protein CKAN_00739300 [Cinnamomum micranthum f. kanehirae]